MLWSAELVGAWRSCKASTVSPGLQCEAETFTAAGAGHGRVGARADRRKGSDPQPRAPMRNERHRLLRLVGLHRAGLQHVHQPLVSSVQFGIRCALTRSSIGTPPA